MGHGERGLCSGQENEAWIHIVYCVFTMFCDLWTKMSAWGTSFAAPSTEYWSIHWSSTHSPTLTTMKFCSFSHSCFPSSTQPAFSCLSGILTPHCQRYVLARDQAQRLAASPGGRQPLSCLGTGVRLCKQVLSAISCRQPPLFCPSPRHIVPDTAQHCLLFT